MLELITADTWIKNLELREEVFKFRYCVFVERLGWEVLSHDCLEFDEYDALLPVYMIARDESFNILATWRLLPTTGPYMLKNTFPELLNGREAPNSEKIWEISRFAFDSCRFGTRASWEFVLVFGKMLCGLCEFGLQQGVREVVVVYDSRIIAALKRLSCTPTWISEPKKIGNSFAVAATFEINPEIFQTLRKKVSLMGPVFVHDSAKRRAA